MINVCLVGSGGIGSVGALALEQNEHVQVTLVVRSLYEHVKTYGFVFESLNYGYIKGWQPTNVVASVQDAVEYGPFDYIVLSTKNVPEIQHNEDVLRPLVTPGCSIVVIQNGIGVERPLMDAFPESFVLGGISMMGSVNIGAKVRQFNQDLLTIGTLDPRPEATERAKTFVELYKGGGKSIAEFHDDLMYRRWCKLMYNVSFNSTTAITGIDVGRLFFSGLEDSIVKPAMRELRTLAETQLGRELPKDLERYMIQANGGNYYTPSMLIDVRHERPMELEVILGNPLRIASELRVETPVLSVLYNLLRGRQFQLLEKRGIVSVPAEPYDRSNSEPLW